MAGKAFPFLPNSFLTMLFRIGVSGLWISLICCQLLLGQETWKLALDKKDIQVYTRTKAGSSIKEFQAHTEIKASLPTVIAALQDYQQHPDWMYQIASAELLEKSDEQNSMLRYVLKLPWPFKARDIVTSAKFEVVNPSKKVRLSLNSQPGYIPETEKHVRMNEAGGFWEVTSVSSEKVKVVYEYYAVPQSAPAWVVNLFIVNGPYETLLELKNRLVKNPYKNIDISWLHQ